MKLSFGKPSTPAEPLLACPACGHVAAGIPREGDRLECSRCHRVVVSTKIRISTEMDIAAARAEFGHPVNHKEWLQACAVRR